MSEKGRIALIFGAVAVVAGGGLFYFFKIHQPKQQRAVAQAEILEWEKRLDAARACLLGPTPASGNSAQALAVREMTPDPWDRATCTKLIGKLSRGVADDTGLMPVEHAWMSIDRAAAKVATAFLDHVDPSGVPFEKRTKESPLPAALQELDAAHADLRKAASMDPPRTATQAALPEAEVIALAHGESRVRSLDAWWAPSAGGAIAFGSTGKGQVQLLLAPGAAPKLLAVPNEALRALPDGSWGAAGVFEDLTLAPVDDRGAFGAMTSLKLEGGSRVLGAVGSFTNGLVAAFARDGIVLARSSGGAFTMERPRYATSSAAAVDLDGRMLVAWSGSPTPAPATPTKPARELDDDVSPDDFRLNAFLGKGDAAPAIVEIGSGQAHTACLTSSQGWIGSTGQVISFDGTTATPRALANFYLVGCNRDAALLHSGDSSQFAVCASSCRMVDITNLPPTRVATVVGDKVHAIRTRAQVLGVWRENQPPVFFALPAKVTPVVATSDGKVLDVLATTDDGAVLVRLPVR